MKSIHSSHTWRSLVLLSLLVTVADGKGPFSKVSKEGQTKAKGELEAAVTSKQIEGGMHLVFVDGKESHFHITGVSDLNAGTPLKRDAIVRIYSMTKPITSVAAMTLWEKGKFKLDDPISKYIPAFQSYRVLEKQGNEHKLVTPSRPVTIRDVFRHTTGFTYGKMPTPYGEYYTKEKLLYSYHGMFPPEMTIAQAANAMARIPVAHHPGARFTYGFNTDLLGRLIEVWSGQSLDVYLAKSIFEPLEMNDTGFKLAKEKRSRFVSCHTWKDGKHVVVDKATDSPFPGGFKFLSGGGGLLSTIDDYAKFCHMVANRGEFQGRRIIKPETIDLMFTNQLEEAAGTFQFGLGFAIREMKHPAVKKPVKIYYWGGYANTAFQIVPELNMFQVFIRQTIPSTHKISNQLFKTIQSGVE